MMTPKERAAMQQALEVLMLAKNSHGIMLMSDPPKDAWRFHDVDLKLVAAITALREALAEPELNLNCKSVQARLAASWGYVKAEQAEQEPVAYLCNGTRYKVQKLVGDVMICGLPDELIGEWVALVDATDGKHTKAAATVRTKDLSDDEIADALYGKGCWRLGVHPDHLREYRRVIQADRELNK